MFREQDQKEECWFVTVTERSDSPGHHSWGGRSGRSSTIAALSRPNLSTSSQTRYKPNPQQQKPCCSSADVSSLYRLFVSLLLAWSVSYSMRKGLYREKLAGFGDFMLPTTSTCGIPTYIYRCGPPTGLYRPAPSTERSIPSATTLSL